MIAFYTQLIALIALSISMKTASLSFYECAGVVLNKLRDGALYNNFYISNNKFFILQHVDGSYGKESLCYSVY